MKKLRQMNKKKKIIITISIILVLGLLSGLFLLYGPYAGFRNFWITTAMTTKSHQYLATWFYSDETINKVLESNKVIEPDSDVDTSLIDTTSTNNVIYKDNYDKEILDREENALYKIIKIKENGYEGYLGVVYDASKVKLGNGGQAVGIVIKDGKIVNNTYTGKGIIGLTNDNKLYLGKISASKAIEKGIRDAVEFGPFLIVNGEVSKVVGNGGYGIHPRSAIGQRSDGIILFLVIDGRRATSLGADMDDLINIMQRYGAVNAANLDGGTSSALVENYQILNKPIDWYNREQTRPIPNGFILVK